nr:hypothetical protein [Kofleriaceae bacterium]
MRSALGLMAVMAMAAGCAADDSQAPPSQTLPSHAVVQHATAIGPMTVAGTTTFDIPPAAAGDFVIVAIIHDMATRPTTHAVAAGAEPLDSWLESTGDPGCNAVAELWAPFADQPLREAESQLTVTLDGPQVLAVDVLDVSGVAGLREANTSELSAGSGELVVGTLTTCSATRPALSPASRFTLVDDDRDGTSLAYAVGGSGPDWADDITGSSLATLVLR